MDKLFVRSIVISYDNRLQMSPLGCVTSCDIVVL